MPDFQKTQNKKPDQVQGKPKRAQSPVRRAPTTAISSPKCSVCQHQHRKFIDKALVGQTPYSEIGRAFDLNPKAISYHDKNHLAIEQAAMRRIVADLAERDADWEEGVRGVLKRHTYLETALTKAQEQLINGEVVIEPRDAVAIIEKLDRIDSQTTDAQVLQMRIEFNAYLQAMKEIVPKEQWERVLNRTQEIASRAGKIKQLGSGEIEEDIQPS